MIARKKTSKQVDSSFAQTLVPQPTEARRPRKTCPRFKKIWEAAEIVTRLSKVELICSFSSCFCTPKKKKGWLFQFMCVSAPLLQYCKSNDSALSTETSNHFPAWLAMVLHLTFTNEEAEICRHIHSFTKGAIRHHVTTEPIFFFFFNNSWTNTMDLEQSLQNKCLIADHYI